MNGIAEQLSAGLSAHRAGQLEQAENVYREILKHQPDHPDALHLSGVIAHQRGDYDRAIDLIRQAIQHSPLVAAYHCNLAEALRGAKQWDAAEASCQQALVLQPVYPEVHHNLGVIYFRQQRFLDAEQAYRTSLSLRPDSALTLLGLADTLRERRLLNQAEATYRQALTIAPHLDAAHANLGLLLSTLGNFEPGLEHCRRAVQLNPQSVSSLHNLGTLLLEYGEIDESLEMLDRALELDPNSAPLYVTIGRVSLELAQHTQALSWFQRALRLDPELLAARCQLAITLLEMGDPEQAGELFQQVLDREPHYVEALMGLARAKLEQGDVDTAVSSQRAAIELFPQAAQLHAALGNTLSTAGDLDAAVACHRQAIHLNPRCVAAHSGLLTTLRNKSTEDDIKHSETLLNAPWMTDIRRAHLHFGLAQGYDGRGDFLRAAEHLATANALQKEHYEERDQGYDPEEHHAYVSRIIETFTPEYFERVREFGNPSRRPVFIVGMPRSGTTLTEQILASHPQIHGAGERRFANLGFSVIPQMLGSNILPIEGLSRLEAAHAQKLATWHLEQLQKLDQGRATLVVDKMPENYHLLGWIVTLFPHARIIHCRRDVRDVALSCWITNFSQIRWANDLEHIATRINEYSRVTSHLQRVLPVPVLDIDYEQMVADQTGTTRKMLEFLGLDWHPACLNFHQTERLVRTASVAQVRQPIYSRSVARWKRYEAALQPLLNNLATHKGNSD